MDDVRIIRERQAAAQAELDRSAENTPYGSGAVLIQTKAVGTYPAAEVASYACDVLQVGGSESEGATPSFVVQADTTVYAINLGSAVPPVGTKAVAHAAGGRLCFRFDSTS